MYVFLPIVLSFFSYVFRLALICFVRVFFFSVCIDFVMFLFLYLVI